MDADIKPLDNKYVDEKDNDIACVSYTFKDEMTGSHKEVNSN